MKKDDTDKDKDSVEISDSTGTYRNVKIEGLDNLVQKATEFFDGGTEFFDGGFVRKTSTTLQRAAARPTPDQALWAAIRDRTNAINFERYAGFIDRVLCESTDIDRAACGGQTAGNIGSPPIATRYEELLSRPGIYGIDAYQLLKLATQAFLLFESGVMIKGPSGSVVPGSTPSAARDTENLTNIQKDLETYLATNVGNVNGRALPYLKRIVSALPSLNVSTVEGAEGPPFCNNILQHRLSCPSLLELIWSYWHEEGMLVQTINAIALRFQNKKRHAQDPLANLALDPLRPLNNLFWGFIQDEPNRLSIQRRCYEYDNQYGITLVGKAVPILDSADSRSQFIKAFHNLLYRTAMFYREDDDTTVAADAFSLLNALREVHIILAEGAHNQFGDLPWTARHEMLVMQWMLARPEMKEFLRGRYSVPYQETWMGAVDDMKRLQGWTDVGITPSHELGVYGEQILLSIRYGDWIAVNDQEQARNWARDWRPEIQRYMHAYHAVSGVDLMAETVDARSAEARYAQPSMLLQKRLATQQLRNRVTGPTRRLANARGIGYASLTNKMAKRLRIERK